MMRTGSAGGLRERKRAKTHEAIQRHALQLFREQGYEKTTIEQIAEAAEVSPSTFFRYFPTKEDVLLYDATDPLIIAAFEAQPPELTPMQALRTAIRTVFTELSPNEQQDLRERFIFMMEVPELHGRMLAEFSRNIQLAAELVARRVGRPPDDFAVRTFAGALIGVSIAVALAIADDPTADFLELLDTGMAHLEAGLPL
jgi:AcrR family transcriptional regulator